MRIVYLHENETLRYAAQELSRYYVRMTGNSAPEISYAEAPCERAITLGLLSALSRPAQDVSDPVLEDVIDIRVENGKGFIAGSNRRSVLMGVYRYLRAAGCRFIRPGEDGEYVPQCDLDAFSFTYRKKADHIFRGECCEGAVSYEHMRDTVYWMPKVGMNMFMIEGLVPYTYMHKWYAHVANLRLSEGAITDRDFLVGEIAKLERDIVKLGLQFHNVGHGWMFEPFGIHHGPPSHEATLPEDAKQYLALVNGKRDFYHSTFLTHFCYSNPEARKKLISFWLDYAKKKPYVDFFHVWLADGKNNHCECEACVKREPSDWYIIFLNELDAALTREGIDAKLVLILYVDTNRPPVTEKLCNPERFVLLSACSIDYNIGYEATSFEGEIPPYVRNQYKNPSAALAHHWRKQWKDGFGKSIPSCVYEYRFYNFTYNDIGGMHLAEGVHRDMKRMRLMGFDGNMSDQTVRSFFPTALPMSILAETLFDVNTDYESFAEDHFRHAFGADADKARAYLEKISEIFDPRIMNASYRSAGVEEDGIGNQSQLTFASWKNNEAFAKRLDEIPAILDAFLPYVEKNESVGPAVHRRSWFYLRHHVFMVRALAKIYAVGARGEIERARELYLDLHEALSEREMEIHEVFDLFLFNRVHRQKLDIPQLNYYVKSARNVN
ncbi:MAG: DUF4838 domain-containing protein [Clostridia bacterium]|nr:DUF4838 domain-containing protein [Clostridia bacterium]